MKQDIHPTYFTQTKVSCACGNTFETGSTVETISTELCSSCHPFFTGKQKLIDTAGHIEKFKQRSEFAKEAQANMTVKKVRKTRGGQKKSLQALTETPALQTETEPSADDASQA